MSSYQFLAICMLRLDFEVFSLLGTGVASITGFELLGGECKDMFNVQVIQARLSSKAIFCQSFSQYFARHKQTNRFLPFADKTMGNIVRESRT